MNFFTSRSFAYGLLALLLISAPRTSLAQTNQSVSRWEKEISAFEASDRTNPPPKGAILFLGSSSIRKWTTLAQDFPYKQVINRGFGGSEIADSTALADRIVFPYEPRLIVFYAGDNDLTAGKSPERIASDYKKFVETVHARLPKTVIAYISIKPSPSRWKLHEKMIAANDKIKAMKDERLRFIDIYPLMLGENGEPKPEFFLSDKLHPSAACYQMWTKVIRPYLD